MVVCIFVKSSVISPLSFFYCIYLILLFFVNLASGLSILLIFSKNQLLDSLIFWRVFHVSISFSSALILIISCLLLGFEFFWSCSSSSFNFDDRVSILNLSTLLMWALIAIYFPLETALNVSQRFWHVVSSFSGFEELLYFCLHFIVYPVNIQEPVVQYTWSCVVLR